MTKIRMDWRTMKLEAEGHAGYGPAGSDIVCAAVSALTQALLNTLFIEEEEGRTDLEWAMDEASGSLAMMATPREKHRERIRDYYRVVMVGLKAIGEQYREHITITEVE